MRTIITLLLIGILCVGSANAQTAGFFAVGYSDLSNVSNQSGKAAKSIYAGLYKQVGTNQNTYYFASGGYSKNGVPTGNASTGEALAGIAWFPILIPRQVPLVKVGIIGQLGAGFAEIDPETAFETALAFATGAIVSYKFNDAGANVFGAIRIVDSGLYDKWEFDFGIAWPFASSQ
jgi:hypothetical protein